MKKKVSKMKMVALFFFFSISVALFVSGCVSEPASSAPMKWSVPARDNVFKMVTIANGQTNAIELTSEQSQTISR